VKSGGALSAKEATATAVLFALEDAGPDVSWQAGHVEPRDKYAL
jgi:hypothetical protein